LVAKASGNAWRTVGWLALFAAAAGGIGYVVFGGDRAQPEAITSIRRPPPPTPTREPEPVPMQPALPPPSVVPSLGPDDASAEYDSGGCPDGLVMTDEVYNNTERGRGCARLVDGGQHINEGTWRIDDTHGMTLSGMYVHGLRQGRWTAWYPSGSVFQQIDFVDDKRSGTWIQWTEDGRKVFEKDYRDDRQDGRTLIYLPDGGVEEQTWTNGVQVVNR
jgi:hypothetical protein